MPTLRPFRFTCLFLLVMILLPACGQVTAITGVPSTSLPATPGLRTVTPASSSTLTATVTPRPLIGVAPESLRGVQIQVWHAFTGASADAFTDQLARFNTLNEWGIVVYQTAYGDYPALLENVDSALASTSYPNMVATLPEQIYAWQVNGEVADLSPFLTDPAWGLSTAEIADIPALFWTLGGEDQRLGAPVERSARLLFYNQTWARELGFNSPPATPDEFHTQACASNAFYRQDANKQNDGYGGWMVNTQPDTVLSWLLAFGGGALQDGNIRFATTENQTALEYLKGLYDEHCAWISTEPNPYESFANRSALFVTGDLAEAPRLAETMSRRGNNDEWTLLPFPGEDGAVVVASGPSLMLLESTPEEQLAAWLFIRWLLTAETQASWVVATGLLPLRLSALDLLPAYQDSHPQWAAVVGNMQRMQAPPPLAAWRLAQYVLSDGAGFIFRTNQPVSQIPSILNEMDATLNELSGR